MITPYCERLRSRFDAYHDGELSPFMFRVIQRHLEACAGCGDEYRTFQRSIEVVRRLSAPEVPARLARKVVRDLSGPGGGAPFPGRWFGFDPAEGLDLS